MKTILQLRVVAVCIALCVFGCHHVREPEPVAQPDFPTIVKLLTAHGVITIRGAQQGPVYSLESPSGAAIFVNITEKELQAKSPELYKTVNEAQAMQATQGLLLMDYRFNDRLPK